MNAVMKFKKEFALSLRKVEDGPYTPTADTILER